MIENIQEMIAIELIVLEETQINEDEAREVAIKAWAQKNILFDGNNTLLLRLDEWALCCMLEPYDVVWASGERGGVPQEHRNTPGVWVAQNSKSDAEYRRLMKSTWKIRTCVFLRCSSSILILTGLNGVSSLALIRRWL
ncbi:MAG: hypothetical protein QMC37_08855 [Flavobacteriales bacterium]